MLYLYFKSFHIIFIVTWMAGLFYLVRLFIYHVEAEAFEAYKKDILQTQFRVMERRLWLIITLPSMILAALFGTGLIILNPDLMSAPWLWLKLLFVLGLITYTCICARILNQLAVGTCAWRSSQLRLWNELATLLLVSIVFLVVLKQILNWFYGLLGFVLFGAVLFLAAWLYKVQRTKKFPKDV